MSIQGFLLFKVRAKPVVLKAEKLLLHTMDIMGIHVIGFITVQIIIFLPYP